MMALDKDRDGKLSRDEIADAPKALKSLDKDGDGTISRGPSCAPPRPPGPPPRDGRGAPARIAARERPGRPRPAAPTTTPLPRAEAPTTTIPRPVAARVGAVIPVADGMSRPGPWRRIARGAAFATASGYHRSVGAGTSPALRRVVIPMTDLSDSATDVSTKPAGPRIESVDLLRGLVMVVMVLDHTRDYFMNLQVGATDLARTTPALFFTRWITHFCAPTFMFLAGVGASLAGSNGMSRPGLARFLLARGLWLVVLDVTVVSFLLFFTVPNAIVAGVLWAIGWSMVALAGLVFLPRWLIGAIGVAMIAGHDLLDGIRAEGSGPLSMIWHILHQQGFLPMPGGFVLFVLYPLVPWIGVMAASYAFGPVLELPRERRRPILIGMGLALTLAFVALRATNVYGDPNPWTTRASPTFTALSFLNGSKYPPSLLYLLMTLGPAIVALGLLDRGAGRFGGPLLTFGRVPLFFYLLQWPVAHGLAVLVATLRGQATGWMFRFPPFQSPPEYGAGLVEVYLAWLVVLALLYAPCRWFAGVKRRHRWGWLSYL